MRNVCVSEEVLAIKSEDISEAVSLTLRPAFNPQEDSWYSFLLEA
jgi:hypothetical protein